MNDAIARLKPEARAELIELLDEREKRMTRRLVDTMFPDTGPLRRELYKKHLEFFEAGKTKHERAFIAANRVGKALKHGTRIATPNGWLPIEDVQVGDKVIAGDGSITAVVGVYPQGEIDVFSLSFDGVHDVVACAEHRWLYQHPRARYPYRQSHGKREPNPFHGEWVVGNTADLMRLGAIPRTRAVIPMTKPWALPEADLPLDPYLMGVLLGDGSFSQESVQLTTADSEIAAAFGDRASKRAGQYEWGILGTIGLMRRLGLQGLTSEHKFVPRQYLIANAEQRLALLQGLMDTDGTIGAENAAMDYATCSDRLADDFCWLAASLGFKTVRERRQTHHQNGPGLPSWRIKLRTGNTCPFRLMRKALRWRPLQETQHWLLHGVQSAGKAQATCIEVEHPSHTFVIEHGIVTHNTVGFGTEVVYHLTGRYPHWWNGRRWDRPVKVLASGDTHDTTRDIIQLKMLGALSDRPEQIGTGLIPWQYIAGWVPRPHVKGAIELCRVKHVSGGESEFYMRSFEQGRAIFQGVELDIFWADEECPQDVYTEGLMRTMTTHGMTGLTFTPLEGRTPLVNDLMDPLSEAAGDRAVVQCGWDDVPHLDEETKKRMFAKLPPHQRDARSRGIPSLGSGAIYPVPEDQIIVPPFALPKHWPRAFGCDVGWNRTAAIWGAFDRETDTGYLYQEHYRAHAEPAIHVAAIKARGAWIPGTIDPAARGRTQTDGEQLLQVYTDLGLPMVPADNAVEAGIYAVWERLSTGRLKVFSTLANWLAEYRGYHRDEKGKIVKLNDHLMDACVVGDTLVHTAAGAVPIAALVGCDGIAVSRAGAACRFVGARLTIRGASTVCVRFSDGSSVQCTPDHPFLTPAGWRRADQMTGLCAYNGVAQRNAWKKSSSSPQPSRSGAASATTCAGITSSETASACTSKCGRQPRLSTLCRLGAMFTTATTIARTTSRRIWNCCRTLSTHRCISVATAGTPWGWPASAQRSGIAPTLAASGIDRTTWPTSARGQRSPVNIAAPRSMPRSQAPTASAATPARVPRARHLALTMSNALAWLAAACSWRIATWRKPAARARALLACVSVERAPPADVYCLTVPGPSAFCVGSGVVVHNTRYLEMTGRNLAVVEAPNYEEADAPDWRL